MPESACRACARRIIWTTSPTGAILPLDARPVTVYAIVHSASGARAVKATSVYSAEEAVELAGPLYISHFLTCPSAREFSGGRKAD